MSEIQNINHLARDRELKTLELHQPNDFYGHATILKKNVGIQNNYQLKTAIEHGVYLKPEGWDVDLKSPLPSMFTFSSFRHRHLKKITDKSLYAIGPYVQYAKPFLNIMESNEQRRRLGNCLLVFPAHSTHWVDVEYNIHKYCQNIETIGKSFNSIRICLYWKDILRGTAKIYGQHGFECVTAGHMYDPQFLPRLKSIIESATITTSNQISTVIGYCITMGKPHFLMESEVELSSKEKKFLDECTNFNQNIFVEEIRKAFKIDLQDEISPDQFAAVEKYWGLGEEKTRDELIEILEEAEDLYRKKAISPLMNMKSGASIDSYEGSWGEVLGKIASKVDKIPRRLPGEIRINNTPIHYVDFHSFYHQANQIFRYDLYGFKCQVDEPLIIDCGAHIGLASIYFAQCFPGAKIMAFEADPTIVKVLEKNIDAFGYKNIKTYPQAIWTNFDGIAFKNSGDDSGYISEQGNEDCIKIPTTRLRDILKENKIDLLKLDIEGAEYEVIRDCDEYLKNVDRIIVEIHKFKDEKVSIGNIFSILEKNNFEYALGDLHSAIWLETSMIQPFKALKTDKFIITVYAWRVDDGCGMDNHSKASNRKYSSAVEMGDSDRLPNMVYKCHGIDKIWQIADHQITGGAAIAGHRLFAGLKSANADVKLIPFNDPTISENCCNSLMQTYNRDQSISDKMSSMSGSPSRNNWIDVVYNALNTDTPQIINVHNIHEAIHYHGVPFGVLDLMAKKARLVFTLHDMWLLTGRCAYNGDCQRFVDYSCNETCPTPTIYPNALPGEISALLRTKMDFFKGNPDAVIVTPSSWLALQVRKSHLKDHRIEVIPYGIDTSVFRPDDDRDGLRRSIGIPPNACVLLISAANLSDPRKGADLLLKALSNTKDELLVLTVGKTDIQPDLPDNIKFYNYGFVTSPEEMAFAYTVADLFICPSLEDNLPCVLIESISCGTPCIGFNVGGIPEVIRPGKTGWLAPEATPKSLSKLITDLHKKPGIISDLRPSCREVAKQEYALNIQAERYLKLYQELIGQEADMPPRANVQKKDRENNLQSDYEVIQKYIENGEIESAKVRLEKLVEINPDFATGHNDLGVLAYREGLKDEAFKHYAAAVKLQPENIIFLKNLADYYYIELGQIEEAMQLYVKVLRIEPKDIETLLVVGHLCVSLEKYSEAKNFYNRIIEIDPDHEEARNFIERLNAKIREIAQNQNDEEKPLVDNLINLNDIDKDKYLVSAIVSTYNAEKFIRGCLEDLENQTIADRLEIIVVNSGSNENEEAIVREFQKTYGNIKYISTANRENVYAAWNRGIRVATGKYITNANTDDRHRTDALEIMVKTLEKHPKVSLTYADVIITETDNETFEKCTPIGTYKWLNWNRDDLLNKGCFMGPQPMWRRDIHSEYGFFDETLVTSGDYEFWLRISQTHNFIHIPVFLGLYLKSQSSIEHRNRRKQADENESILKRYKEAHLAGKIIRNKLNINESNRDIFKSSSKSNVQAYLAESMHKEIVSEFSIERHDATIKRLEKLLKKFPDFALAHNDLGVLYYKNGVKPKALESYRRAVGLDSNNITYRKNLADLLYVEEGKVEDALENYIEVLRIKPDDIETLFIAGHICVSLEKYEDAETFYNRVIEIDPGNLEAGQYLDALNKKMCELKDDSLSVEVSDHQGTQNIALPGELLADEPKAAALNHTQASIIMLLEGPGDAIRKCYASIRDNTKINYELIFVENGAGEAIKNWAQKTVKKNIRCRSSITTCEGNIAEQLNNTIESIRSEYIVIIRDLIRVPEHWLTDMIETLEHSADIGLVGTITSGNADEKYFTQNNDKKYRRYANRFRMRNRHRRISIRFIDSSCIVFKRNLVNSIGEFNPSFTDKGILIDDFCQRSAAAGYRNLISGDIFTHLLGRGLNPSRGSEKTETYYSDLRIFKKKWNEFITNTSNDSHLELQNIIGNGDKLFQKGQSEKGIEVFLEGIRRFPEDHRIYLSFAERLINIGRFQDALDALGEIPIDANESNNSDDHKTSTISILKAYCEEGLGNYDISEKLVDQVLQVQPDQPKALNLRGILAYRKNDKSQAAEFFKHAIRADPGYGEPHTNLGSMLWESKDTNKALNFFERGFILSPADTDVAATYHEAVSALNEFEPAEQTIREALDLYPANRKLHYILIDVLLQLGKQNEAMVQIERAISAFGIEDGMLDAALKVREQIGPVEIEKRSKKKATVSLCMIVKNEEEFIANCLKSIKPFVNEMIIVDTGSTDRTIDIATVFGAKVYDFEWTDDFAIARNFSISKAKGDWVLIMDADEVISMKDYDRFKRLVTKKPVGPEAYSIVTRNYCHKANKISWNPNDGYYANEEDGIGWLPSKKVRLFSNNYNIKFEGAVHEMVDPLLKRNKVKIKQCTIPVHHYGSLNKGKYDNKGLIYYEIGRKKLAKYGCDIRAVRELAIQATVLERNSESIDLWQKFLTMKPNEAAICDAYINMVTVYIRMKDYQSALRIAYKAAALKPGMKETQYNLGIAELYNGNIDAAINALKNLVKTYPDYPPAQFMLAATKSCQKGMSGGNGDLKELKGGPLGSALPFSVAELAEGLMAADQYKFAFDLIHNAIEDEIVNKEIMDLYACCIGKIQETQNKIGSEDYSINLESLEEYN